MDSGAQVSLLPATSRDKRFCPGKFTLRAVNGSLIHTYGERCMEIDLGLHRTYTHVFIVAAVNGAILGADFLQTFGLIVDLHGRCLRDQERHLKVGGVVKAGTPLRPTVAHTREDNVFAKMLRSHPQITIPSFHKEVLPHSITHYIETVGPLPTAEPGVWHPTNLRLPKQNSNRCQG